METSHLTPISEKRFSKSWLRVEIQEQSSEESKAMLGYCPQGKPEIKVEISDETGFCQVFSIMKVAAKTCMRDLKWLCHKIRHWQ